MFVALLLLVIFVYSTQIAFGINDAKNYYFQLVMIFGIGLYGIGLYKERNIEFQKYSLFDYMLVLTIIYLSLRTSPFIDEFLNFQLFIILYFVIKQGMFDSKYQYKMVLINNNCMCFIVILELIVILQSFIGLFQAYGIFESLNPRYKITGTTVNPAYYSFFLAASYPLILSIHIYLSISIYRNIKLKILTYIAFLCSVSVLIITENRSSWVSLVLSSIFLLLCIKSFRVTIKTIMLSRILKIISFMVTVFCLVIGIVFVYNFKYDSSYGRLLIWKISNSMIFENPIFGIGYNKFEVLYNIYQQKYFSNNDFLPHDVQIADYIQVAYNEYLQLLIETGIIGFLLFVIIIVYFFMQLLKYINRTSVDENCDFHYFVNIGLFISITSILIMSLFSYPLHYLPVRIIFIINIAILSGLMKNKMRKKKWCVSSIKFIYLFLICLLIMNSLSNVGYKKMWKLAIKEYDKGNYSQSCSIYQAIYPRTSVH